jgi:hypothetical protein
MAVFTAKPHCTKSIEKPMGVVACEYAALILRDFLSAADLHIEIVAGEDALQKLLLRRLVGGHAVEQAMRPVNSEYFKQRRP